MTEDDRPMITTHDLEITKRTLSKLTNALHDEGEGKKAHYSATTWAIVKSRLDQQTAGKIKLHHLPNRNEDVTA